MSRRRGQTGSISKNGNWWTVRFWTDVPGQETRVYMREKLCPTSGPGFLSASERKRRAKEIIEASGADKAETLRESLASLSGTTFRQQSEAWLRMMKRRDVAPSTIRDWESCLNTWLLPTSINGTPFGKSPARNHQKNGRAGLDRPDGCRWFISGRALPTTSKLCGWFFRPALTRTGKNFIRAIGGRWD
jgi:hypothetical protein